MFLSGDDNKAGMAAAARALRGPWVKTGDGTYFDLSGRVAGLSVRLCAYRDQVCTKVVTGTREVTKMVKDPAALASVPEIEVTETVEDVEWQCSPLLASRRPQISPALMAHSIVSAASGGPRRGWHEGLGGCVARHGDGRLLRRSRQR